MADHTSPDAELLGQFLIEVAELVRSLEVGLETLSRQPAHQDALDGCFRAMHNLKGTAGWLGFGGLESLALAAEDALDNLRKTARPASEADLETLREVTAVLSDAVGHIRDHGSEPQPRYAALIAALANLRHEATHDLAAGQDEPQHDHEARGEGRSVTRRPGIRVDVKLLDELMACVSELVLVRNEVSQLTTHLEDVALGSAVQRLSQVTTDLHEKVMKTRMQTMEQVFAPLPRLVRDLTLDGERDVALQTEGGATELDRTLVEAVRDPLTHLIRNAVDHGIEARDERRARGKPTHGTIRVVAAHAGGRVELKITDDGRGIDPQSVKRRALEKGLVTPEQVEGMADRELLDLIFLPGLSTADQVTMVSGRGVGMDVVRTNIEQIGGTVDVESRPGEGTTFRLAVPLTLAIIPALIVSDNGQRYAIAQTSLLELVRLEGQQAVEAMESVQGAPLYRLRGQLLPLVYLGDVLGTRTRKGGTRAQWDLNIVVVEIGIQRFGLVVDMVHDTEEIVVKALGPELSELQCFSGATIMGDGKVALILDVAGLAKLARVTVDARERARTAHPQSAPAAAASHPSLLLARTGDRQVGLPLHAVDRLEELPRDELQERGGHAYIRYAGGILPLMSIEHMLDGKRRGSPQHHQEHAGESVHVIVHRSAAGELGLLVDQIVDVVDAGPSIDDSHARPGVIGMTIVHDEITEVIDVKHAGLLLQGLQSEDADAAGHGG